MECPVNFGGGGGTGGKVGTIKFVQGDLATLETVLPPPPYNINATTV